MSILAHVGGVPVEELLLPAMTGTAAGLAVARGWIIERLRRRGGTGR